MLLRRPLLLAASFVMILALGLLIGGDRFLATDQVDEFPCAAEAEARLPAPFTFLCSPADLQRGRAALARDGARQGAARDGEQAQKAFAPRRDGPWPARDANGNVLQPGRYMQAVYFAFALGDVGG